MEVYIFAALALAVCHGQLMHSVHRMERVVGMQAQLTDQLRKYIHEERARLQKLEQYVDYYASKTVNNTPMESVMSHPVRVFRLMEELSTLADNLNSVLQPTNQSADLSSLLGLLPSRPDYISAALAVARLESIYKNQADYSSPSLGVDALTGEEYFNIAKALKNEKKFYLAMKNMEKAMELYKLAGSTQNYLFCYEHLAIIVNQLGYEDVALNYTYDILKKYRELNYDNSHISRLEENIKIYITKMGGEETAARLLSPPRRDVKNPESEYPNYHELCRGESVSIKGKSRRPLRCRLVRNNPLLLLAPAKLEEIAEDAGLSFYHDVISDNEIQTLKILANQKIADSTLIKAPNTYRPDYQQRSSNTGWVSDRESKFVHTISRRIGAILGLDLASCESLQVLSYGIGGFYLPHYDYVQDSNIFQPPYGGNRIATWIFYLNDVDKGGATAFTNLGVTVWPKKGGAAFWWNLHRNGTVNPQTLHAACPVLEGFKWVSNKWFHEHGNEFHRKCTLNSLE